ncbi:UvrD-helicase domain-containing protein [Streptomyces sp. NPDC017941]|uniref:UvrD-helicase domain-containing protein n=1 Tax=Streptomyces sp. NPDC017941 TaxID=3365018 RepID=UPI0037AB279E
MTAPYVGSPSLTDEQQAVVEQPWDARLLVTAAAGSGKTHTLVRRLDRLVRHEDPDEALEAGEILVLSFSRAAVRELRDRITRHGERARRVRVQTFDSWAYSLLVQAHPDTEWGTYSFEERIRAATDAIGNGAVEVSEAGRPAHVLIDEVQDLVGERRDMVETLLDRFQDSCGFTVVGDPAQSIYGFQIADPVERASEVDRFFDWLRVSYLDDLVELHLTHNFRAATVEARTVLPLGSEVQRLAGDAQAAELLYDELRARLLDLPGLGGLSDPFTAEVLKSYPGSCAILTRDNRQALVVSELLYEHGVAHTLKRSLRDRPVPVWVSELLRRTDAATLSEQRFREVFGELALPGEVSVDEVWRRLRGAARGRNRALVEVARLRRLVAEGCFPEELATPESPGLLVSTVHHAKGLEFDRVLLTEPPTLIELGKRHKELDTAAETRSLYVAMTRAREDMYHVVAPDTSRIRRCRRTARCYVSGWKPHQRYGVEVTSRDVCREEPPGAHSTGTTAADTQMYLSGRVRPGDAVSLCLRDRVPMGADQSPPYELVHEGRVIGEASEGFRRDLYALEKINSAWKINWPDEIHSLRVDTLESVAGGTAAGTNAGLGDSGIWIAPRICGIGRYRRGERIEEEQG